MIIILLKPFLTGFICGLIFGLLIEIVSAIKDGKDDENFPDLWKKMNVLRDIIPSIVKILYSEKKILYVLESRHP